MLHRIEIYREPCSLNKDNDSDFTLKLLQTIESEYLSVAVDFGINFMRSEFEFADLRADDITVGSFICSDPSGLDNSVKKRRFEIALSILGGRLVFFYPNYFLRQTSLVESYLHCQI